MTAPVKASKTRPGQRRPTAHPYLFVVGCPRSGTTLLQRMLDHHPKLAVSNDTHFITRCIEKTVSRPIDEVIRRGDLPLTEKLVETVRTYHRFARLGLPRDMVTQSARESQTYCEFVSALYERFCRMHNKSLSGEKTPDYSRHIRLLHVLFPWARFLHIIRDGRDVALSALEWAHERKGPGRMELWKSEPIGVCALWWAWLVGTGREQGHRIEPSLYCEVKYESLVSSPRNTLAEVTRFLHVPFSTHMLLYFEGRVNKRRGKSAKSDWLPPTRGLRDWRTQMRTRDLELFEALAGRQLSLLGYARAVRQVSPHIDAVANTCRQWWRACGPVAARQQRAL